MKSNFLTFKTDRLKNTDKTQFLNFFFNIISLNELENLLIKKSKQNSTKKIRIESIN